MRQCSGVHTIGSKHNRGNIRRSQSVSAPSPPNLTNHRHIISTAIPQQCDLFMIASNSSFNNWSLNHFNFSDDSTTMSSCMISRLLSTGAVFACISLLNWHYETPSRDQTSLISYLTPDLIHQQSMMRCSQQYQVVTQRSASHVLNIITKDYNRL